MLKWIPIILLAGFFNSLWTALSRKHLVDLSAYDFTLLLRALTSVFLFPFFLMDLRWPLSSTFWLAVCAAGILEILRIGMLSAGIRKDYYSTYAIYNTAPLFTLILAPRLLPEKISLPLILGVGLIIAGTILFYGLGKLSLPGLFCAITSAISAIISKIAIMETSAYFFTFLSFTIGVVLMALCGRIIQKRDLNFFLAWPIVIKLIPLAFYSFIATLFYYLALEWAPVSKVQPLMRSNLFFSFLLSYFLLKEKKDWRKKLLAGVIIFAGCVLITIA